MKFKKLITLSVFPIVFCILLVFADDIWETSLDFTYGPIIHGPSGTFTKFTDEKGNESWSPYAPVDMTVYLDASLDGGGDAMAVLTSATIAHKSWSLEKTSTTRIGDKKISSWEEMDGGTSVSHTAQNCSLDPGTYRWSASGYVETTTYELERTVELTGPGLGVGLEGLENISGGYTTTWVVLHKDKTPLADGINGAWKIIHKYKCSICSYTTEDSGDFGNHICEILCSECNEEVDTKQEHFLACGSEVPGAISGCGLKYWTCQGSGNHTVLMCGRWNSWHTDICGDLYRECSNDGFPFGGCYYWNAHINGVEVCIEDCFGTACSGCDF